MGICRNRRVNWQQFGASFEIANGNLKIVRAQGIENFDEIWIG